MTIRRAVTLSIGDELLAGETLDTHGRTIASALTARGCRVVEHRVLGDDASGIASAIAAWCGRSAARCGATRSSTSCERLVRVLEELSQGDYYIRLYELPGCAHDGRPVQLERLGQFLGSGNGGGNCDYRADPPGYKKTGK